MISIYKKTPTNIIIVLEVFFLFLLIFTSFRLIFFLFFIDEIWTLSIHYLIKSFWIGFRFDIRLSVLIILPMLLTCFQTSVKWLSYRQFWEGYLVTAFLIILLTYFIDFGFFIYLNSRLDASVIGLLKNIFISASMVWETYPMIWLSLCIMFFTFIFKKIIDKNIFFIFNDFLKVIFTINYCIIFFLPNKS